VKTGWDVGALGQLEDSTVTAIVSVVPSSASAKAKSDPSADGRTHGPRTGVFPRIIQTSYTSPEGGAWRP
jgi:hypothetical protein